MFNMSSFPGNASDVISFETELASITVPSAFLSNPMFSYNPTTFDELRTEFPWLQPYFSALAAEFPQFTGDNALVDTTPTYFHALEALLSPDSNTTVPLSRLKSFSAWSVLRNLGAYVTEDAGNLLWEFFSSPDPGEVRSSLEERCRADTIKELWGLTDRMFVERSFGREAQVQMEIMVNTIKDEFKAKLEVNSWMDDTTRAAAIEKLQEMNYKIGAPTKWPKYNFVVGQEYLGNKLGAWKDKSQQTIVKYKSKVDNTEWGMSPSEVNAYYSPVKNEMVFPAGILQPPFFDADAPMVTNYASIGSIMGHELTHGFDDTGALFDKFGEYRDWWTPDTKDTYERKTQCFVDQYDALELPALQGTGLFVWGNMTLGENIADNGGAGISLNAYLRYAAQYGAPSEFQVGDESMTAEKLFWVGWGQAWCKNQTLAGLMYQVQSDEHAPSWARVNGVAQNSESFAKSAGCTVGSPMNPPVGDKCPLW